MNSVLYAEQIIRIKQTNQFFIQFYVDHPEYDPQDKVKHFEWFNSYLLACQPVATVGLTQVHSDFYHVNFVDPDDPRLEQYCLMFEDSSGLSLNPNSYQLVEWSWHDWIDREGDKEFDEFFNSLTTE